MFPIKSVKDDKKRHIVAIKLLCIENALWHVLRINLGSTCTSKPSGESCYDNPTVQSPCDWGTTLIRLCGYADLSEGRLANISQGIILYKAPHVLF